MGTQHDYRVVRNAGDTGTVYLYDEIGEGLFGGVSAKQFADDINELDVATINVRINSPGGSVFDGIAMMGALRRHPARIEVSVDGVAASIASAIAMAGDHIDIADGGFMMIHDPYMMTGGTAAQLRKDADLLDKTHTQIVDAYQGRTGLPAAEIASMMASETWLGSAEAIEHGFADSVSPAVRVAARFDMSRFRNTPHGLDDAPPDPLDDIQRQLVEGFARLHGRT